MVLDFHNKLVMCPVRFVSQCFILHIYKHVLKETLYDEISKMNDLFTIGAAKTAKNRDANGTKSGSGAAKKNQQLVNMAFWNRT